jgi:hypothetical protein
MAFTLTGNHGAGVGASVTTGTVAGTGNLLILWLCNTTASTENITAITDAVGSNWSASQGVRFGDPGVGDTFWILWAIAGGTGANAVTVTYDGGSTGRWLWAEFSGTSVSGCSSDGTGSGIHINAGSGTQTYATPTITTTGADDLIINVNDGPTCTVNSPWVNPVGGSRSYTMGYQADVTANTYTPSMTATAAGSSAMCFAIKAAGGGADVNVWAIN